MLNQKGTMPAHGIDEKFVGEDFIDLADSDQVAFKTPLLPFRKGGQGGFEQR